MYATTHYVYLSTHKRAIIAQTAISKVLNAALQQYNAQHNTAFTLQSTIKDNKDNTVSLAFTVTQACYNTAVALFNNTVQLFYKFKCTQMHFSNIRSNSYVRCCNTNAQVY